MINYYAIYTLISWLSLGRYRLWVLIPVVSAFFSLIFYLPDYESYKEIYFSVSKISSFQDLQYIHGEYGYLALSFLFNLLRLEYDLFRFFIVFLIVYIKIYVARKIGVDLLIFCFAYFSLFFYMETVAIRQGLATSLIALSFLFISQKRYVYSVFLAIFSILIHKITLVFIPLYLLYLMYKNFREIFKYFVIIVLIFSSFFIDFRIVIELLFGFGSVFSTVESYSTSIYGQAVGKISGAKVFYLFLIITYVIMLRKDIKDPENFVKDFSLFLMVIGYFWLISFTFMEIISERGFRIFSFFFCLGIAFIAQKFRPKFISSFLIILLLLSVAFFVNPFVYQVR